MKAKKRKVNNISVASHVLVKWACIDAGKMSILPINMVTNVPSDKIVENNNYMVKFTAKNNSGVYEATVMAVGSKEECLKIQELNIKGLASKVIFL